MMKSRMVKIMLMAVMLCGLLEQTQAQQKMKLVYDKPAADWNEALPIGNSRLGAMVFGNPSREQIQLNEETIWAGEPGNNVPKNTYDKIVEIRRLLAEGKPAEAQALSNETFPRQSPEDLDYGMPYQTFGSLWLNFPGHEAFTDFHRELDIQDAVARTSYTVNGVRYNREVFASFTDDVVLVRLTSSKKNALSFSIGLSTPQVQHTLASTDKQLILKGTSGSFDVKTGKVQFEGIVRPILKGGKLSAHGDQLSVDNADEVILYISIGTNFNKYNDLGGNPSKHAQAKLDKAIGTKYAQALQNHSQKYQSFFNRVQLDLGTSAQAAKTTDVRVREFATTSDPALVSLYFQFGRYLLISSSQPGGQPANLQGIWNDKLNPPWDSKYTVNINTEMNYWPAEVTNLSEMHEPLFSMLEDLSVTGQESAKEMYRARGWNMHHNTDLWRITGVVDGGYYGMWPMGGAWLSQHIWQHYLYNGQKSFLQKYYEILKGKALFYLDVLHEDRSGRWLVLSPSMSPENSYLPGSIGISAGTTMDNQLIFDVFHNFIDAAKILGTDAALADSVQLALDRLPPMQIGQHTQLQEWLEDLDKTTDQHRHISHLYGLYPAGQISPFRHPDLTEAAINSLIYRGDKSTGWSMGWKVNWWARLLDGNQTYKLIQEQLSPPVGDKGQGGGTYPNLLDAHPPFQIDGNFGCTSGIAEMLVQSYDGNIFILPALPDAFPQGSISGLKVRGGFEIDIAWADSKLTTLRIKSALGGNCRLRLAAGTNLEGDATLQPATGENANPFYQVHAIKAPLTSEKASLKGFQLPDTKLVEFNTEPSKQYTFTNN
ncbi:glycosyl hydrolase family 95 catalytic domain-containing protein [Sphingobacterium sp. FBM7-1]|uniref:glycoside hydrolase family 95 protein n=1 Tax=Sphingobacterium sp. FBM7-1 TaxID=2886688 RepID=UPI001D11FFA8|nr:glycoside hydrolase family 95 protein [Sphingobacterium sp. FBM7-1]MCC2600721.1 glycoside hydrolase family 95 protein [Sphingobacterium sp. FBM7-1]